MQFCSNCGAKVEVQEKFCSSCGQSISKSDSNEKKQPSEQALGVNSSNASGKQPQSGATPAMSYIPTSITDKLPSMVKVKLLKSSPETQSLFAEEYRRKKKSTGLAYLFWFILGFHYIYLGKIGWQILYWLTLGGLFIWWFIDIFRIPGLVKNYNKDVAIDVFRDLKVISS